MRASKQTRASAAATALFAIGVVAASNAGIAAEPVSSVLQYHGGPSRSGDFTISKLTYAAARRVRLDPTFHSRVTGHVYAQPLYWRDGPRALLFVATESNQVSALDARTGRAIWRRTLGRPVPRADLPCGDINPLGITGTPALDPNRKVLYFDADVQTPAGPRHFVFALNAMDGAILPGWPVDVEAALLTKGLRFNSRVQNQRSALALLGGRIYIPFGGHYGDCGDYHGWVVGVRLANPRDVVAWTTRARGGGVWSPGGLSSDGRGLFAVTGNTFAAKIWSDGEAVFRLPSNLARTTSAADYFAPKDWRSLDARDLDLSGSDPMLLNVRGRPLLLALGKDGRAYLLDRRYLGGIGGALVVRRVSTGPIRTGPATFPTPRGANVAFQGAGAHCPTGLAGQGLTMLAINGDKRPSIRTIWCAALNGRGSPIVTTTDGSADPIVWVLGAEGDNRLHAYRGDNGRPIANPAASVTLSGLRHFQTLIATRNRLYAAADGRVYAFDIDGPMSNSKDDGFH